MARVGLVIKVNLQRRVDAGHLGLLSDLGRVVGALGAQHANSLVEIDPVIKFARTKNERRGDRQFGVERTGPGQAKHAVAKHLCPDSKPSAAF